MIEIKTTKTILKEMLQELIPFIKGPWFLSDGGLLGIIRQQDLLDHDDDLDLYLMPHTRIEIPEDSNLAICDYYMEKKVYRKDEPKFNPNRWLEYLSYLRCIPEARGMNRRQLFSFAKSRYAIENIEPEFSKPYIDIFELKYGDPLSYHYCIPIWTEFKNQYYTIPEVESLEENNDLGFKIFIPKKAEDVLERLYGENWRIENQKFLY
tara:strand:+ start:721 stop:1344 length:624 start_codon:yes stop_codon:yes gene_type:complete